MSNSYSACAFFGTFTPCDSDVGKKLARFIEGGTPGTTRDRDIVIDEVGSWPTAETWIVVRHRVAPGASRDDDIIAPVLLGQVPHFNGSAIARWLKDEGIDPAELPPIGWHFAATCS